MGIRAKILRNILVARQAGIGSERMGRLWSDACSEHVRAVAHVRRDGSWRERRVREATIRLEAAHAVLEGLEGRRGVSTAIIHSIIVGKIGMIAGATDVGYPTLREEIWVVTVGEVLLVSVHGEDGRMLNASHGITRSEGGDFARAPAVRRWDAAHHIIRITVGVAERGH